LGFKELPKNIPLLEIFNQFPITTPIIGGMLLVVNIAAIAISFGPEPKGLPPGPTANPEIRNQLWKVATIMSTASFLLSTCLLAIVLVRPTWCPPSLCQPVAAVNPNAVRDENLELS